MKIKKCREVVKRPLPFFYILWQRYKTTYHSRGILWHRHHCAGSGRTGRQSDRRGIKQRRGEGDHAGGYVSFYGEY